MPTGQGIRLHVDQRAAPREEPAQSGHHPAGGVVRASGSGLALLKEGQLLAEKEIFSEEGGMGPRRQNGQRSQIEKDANRGSEAVDGAGEKRWTRHEGSGLSASSWRP